MKIVVFGATGPSGLNLVQQALDRGMGVTALVRNPDRLTITHENLKVEKVNIFKEDEIVDHIKECDVVMGCLGSHGSFFSRLPENLYTESAKVILSAMRKANKKRFIVISAGGVINDTKVDDLVTLTVTFSLKIDILDFVAAGDISVSQTHLVSDLKAIINLQEPLIMTIFRPLRIREVLNNLREMEVMLENSTDIDFTAVRPPALSNAQVTDKEIKTEVDAQFVTGASTWMARADVTRFMLDCAEKDTFKRQCVAVAT